MTTKNSSETTLSSTHHKPAPAHRSRKLPFIVGTLIITAGIAYSLLMTQQLHQQLQTLITADLAIKQQQNDLKTQLEASLEQLDAKQREFNNKLEAVSGHLSQALQERWYQNHDWVLLKARYYLELAETNSIWGHDSQTTLALLQQADALLIRLHNPELSSVRQALTQEMTQLQTNSTVDIVALLVKLDVAQELLPQLSIKKPFTLTKNDSFETTKKTSSSWHDQLEKSIRSLKKLVLIRHHDEAVEPLLSPEYESILRENGLLNLQEAQWAVMQRNQTAYQLSLKQAVNTINRGFDQHDPKTQALLAQLLALQKVTLYAQQPLSKEAMSLLNQLIQSKKVSGADSEATSTTDTKQENSDQPESNETTPDRKSVV